MVHYEIFFEDEEGGHIGFYGDGYFGGIFQEGQIRPDDEINLEKYNQVIMDNLDDKIMREAIDLAIKEGIKKYGLTHHCQHFVKDDVIPRYDHQKMIDELEVKLGDKIGGIKDEFGAGLGAGLDARPRAEFDNRPGGIGNGLGNGVGGLGGNGFGNGFDIGGGIGNRPGGIGFDNRPGGFRDGLDARPRAEFDNRPGGIGNGVGGLGGIGGLGNGPGGVRGELGAGLGAMLDAGLGPGGRLGGEHGGVGNNNRPGGLGGNGFGNGAGGFGGGGFGNGPNGFGGMNFGGGPGGFGRF